MYEKNGITQIENYQAEFNAKLKSALSIINSAASEFLIATSDLHFPKENQSKRLLDCNINIKNLLDDTLKVTASLRSWNWVQSTELLKTLGVENPTRRDTLAAANYLKTLNGGQQKRSKGKTLFLCPPIVSSINL